ncbi:MAG: DUF3857 domain-containing protein [Bacteroidota bacterium]
MSFNALKTKAFLLFAFSLLISLSSFSQGKNFSINRTEPKWKITIAPQQKKPAAKDISDGYFLSLYENQNHIELQEDYTRIIREIVSDAGVQNGSQISVTYDPGYQKLAFHKVTIWRNGIPSDRLNALNFKILQSEKELSRFIYSGTFDALLVLDDVRKGDRIEFSYTLSGYNPIYGARYASLYYFESSSSIGHVYYNVIFAKSRDLSFKNFNFADTPKITEKANLKMYEWENTLTKTHRTSDSEPNWYNPLRRVQLTEYKSWSEVVNWALAVNDYPDLKTPAITRKVTELKKLAGKDLKKYIELSTRFVQDEIRYMGIEIGAYSHRPNSPEKVLIQRYGDCKDKSLLLVRLLNSNGIDAYLTYASTSYTLKTGEYLPSPFVFNHVIVMVNHNNQKTWIDPTIAYQRGKFDDFYAPNYGAVLVVKKGINALETIESKPEGKLLSNLTFKLGDTTEGSKTTLTIYSVYKDNYADDMRAQIAESGADNTEKSFLDYYKKLYPGIDTKENIVIEDDESNNILEINESYEISDIWTELDDNKPMSINFYGDVISYELTRITDKKRKSPIALKHTVNIEQNITVELPYTVNTFDENYKVESSEYYFDVYTSQLDSTIKFSYTYKNKSDHLDPINFKTYIKDINKIDQYLTYTLNRGGNVAGGNDNNSGNYYMMMVYIVAMAISSYLCFRLYIKKTPYQIEEIADARPLGGWLVVLGLRVIAFPIAMLIKPFTLNLFGNEVWNNIALLAENSSGLKMLMMLEVVMFALCFVYGFFCAILFFNRRKEFPKHFVILCLSYIGFVCYDWALSAYINKLGNLAFTGFEEAAGFVGALVFGVIVTYYLQNSQRVKQTFVFTYPRSDWESKLAEYYNQLFTEKKEHNHEDI